MKKTLLIIILIFSQLIIAQEKKSIVGEWKVVSVDNGEVYLNAKTDSVSTSKEFDKIHNNKVSRQDGIAEIRAFSSHNEFIFTENKDFKLYLDYRRNENTLRLSGTYEIIDQKNMTLKVEGRTKRLMNKTAEFEFINNQLIFKFEYIASRKNKPTIYVLEKIK